MSSTFDWAAFTAFPVVGILRNFPGDLVAGATAAAQAGGLAAIEVTMNSPGAAAQITALRAQCGAAMGVGAGTVCTPTDLDTALAAGAQFIVTPVLVPAVIAACRARGVPVFPGAFTPTEIHQAWSLGADVVKVFPADGLGPAYFRALRGPLPQVRLMPTGGVTVETVAEYRRAGAFAFGVGGPLFDPRRVQARDWPWITAQVTRFRAALAGV